MKEYHYLEKEERKRFKDRIELSVNLIQKIALYGVTSILRKIWEVPRLEQDNGKIAHWLEMTEGGYPLVERLAI